MNTRLDALEAKEISYNDLTDRPKINNVELIGNRTRQELGIPQTKWTTMRSYGYLNGAQAATMVKFRNTSPWTKVNYADYFKVTNNATYIFKFDSIFIVQVCVECTKAITDLTTTSLETYSSNFSYMNFYLFELGSPNISGWSAYGFMPSSGFVRVTRNPAYTASDQATAALKNFKMAHYAPLYLGTGGMPTMGNILLPLSDKSVAVGERFMFEGVLSPILAIGAMYDSDPVTPSPNWGTDAPK